MWLWVPEGQDAVLATLRRATVMETDDSGSQQFLKRLRGLASERPEQVYRAQPHGFTSHPPQESEGLFLSLSGRSDRIIALGFEHKDHRPKNLPEGGSALYDHTGKILKLIENETVLEAGDKPVRIIKAQTLVVEASEKITFDVGGTKVAVRKGRIDLGADPAPCAVLTECGPSPVVFAVA